MLLKQAGKLSLDDQLVKYIPELPYRGMTLRQVLNHTSGLPDYGPLMQRYWDQSKIATNDDIVTTRWATCTRTA